LAKPNASRQMSAIRTAPDGLMRFDYLAGLLVDDQFLVTRAALVPVSVVQQRATYQSHTNNWRFFLHDDVSGTSPAFATSRTSSVRRLWPSNF